MPNTQDDLRQPQWNVVPSYNSVVYKRGARCYAEDFQGHQLIMSSTSDDQAVIQAALDKAGRILIKEPLAANPYTLDNPLDVYSNTWLQGENWNVELQRTTGVILRNINFGTVGSDTNIRISNLAARCTAPTTANDGNIVFDGATNVIVDYCKSTDSPTECIKVRSGTRATFAYNTVERSKINAGTGKAGIMFSAGSGETAKQCNMIGNHALDCGGEAFGINGAATSTHFLTNIIGNTGVIETSGNRGQIHLEGSSGSAFQANVIGNSIHSDYYGIVAINCQRTAMIGNNISHFSATDALDGISIQGASLYHAIVGNTIFTPAEHGIEIIGSSGYASVVGNTIINPSAKTTDTYSGIAVIPAGAAGLYVNIGHNTIVDNLGGSARMKYGIALDGSSAAVTSPNVQDNTIIGAVTAGMLETATINTPMIRNNIGYVTEARGTGSIASGATTAVITHGLAYTPVASEINISFTENPSNTAGTIWIDTITSTQFTVNCENDPGASNLDFGWSARRV